jgi:glycosyltransferase involved in cell wall biosynthesis
MSTIRSKSCRPRTLILVAKAPSSSLTDEIRNGEGPRVEYLEIAEATRAEILDLRSVAASTHPLVRAAAKIGPLYGLAMLGILRRDELDHIYATGEDIGMPLAALCHATRWYGHVTVVVHQCDTKKRRFILRMLGDGVWRNVIVLAGEQWRILTEDLGIPANKVHRVDQWIDSSFYDAKLADPAKKDGDYALSCGRESRDYPTLQRAVEGLPYEFRVVASGMAWHAGFDAAVGIANRSNVKTMTGVSYRELRDLYANARLVVVPLNEVSYAAGVTSICEGMSLGKAIVVADSPGIRDHVKNGVSALVYPPGDDRALRAAITTLWNDPERCAKMGEHNRRWVERVHETDRYARTVAGLFGIRSE